MTGINPYVNLFILVKRKLPFLLLLIILQWSSIKLIQGQNTEPNKPDREFRWNLNEDGSHYLKATFTAQIWARYNQSNPGSTLFGYPVTESYDIGLRRVRSQFFGKIHDQVFFYSQAGINNFTTNSARKPGIFFHDVLAELQLTPRSIQVGMGLTAWTGFGRYSSPAVATFLGFDAPLYQQSTNDGSDQFLRKLSIYAKGKVNQLDYRLVLSTPMTMQTSAFFKPLSYHSEFSLKPPKLQGSGYFMWQFLDEESNLTPYLNGTYLGKKRVFNLGAGFQYQPKAMWRYSDTAISPRITIEEDMLNFHADVFYDAPFGSSNAAISVYGAFTHFGFGKDYLRGQGVMNPSDATSPNNLIGGGNSIPMVGSGNVFFLQAGYLLPTRNPENGSGRFMPFIMYHNSNLTRLSEPARVLDIGLNYLIENHRAKITLDIQNRPTYNATGTLLDDRKNTVILQFQVAF